MADNITVDAPLQSNSVTPSRYLIPLLLNDAAQQTEVIVTINNFVIALLFNLNPLDNNLYLSAYTLNKSIIYFAGFRCVFGNYINLIDNGCPYLFYFLDESNLQTYVNSDFPINFDAISNGVNLYAEFRQTI